MTKTIGPPEILDRARAEARRLGELTNWKAAFAESAPEAPLLVQRRDKTDADFYIVSFRVGRGVTARLRMNAHTGEYAEGIGIDKKGDVLKAYYTLDQARQRIGRSLGTTTKRSTKSKKKKTPGKPGSDQVAIGTDPFPLWRPCAQSLSPFLPFYRFWAPGQELYFRVDGKLYSALTFGAGL